MFVLTFLRVWILRQRQAEAEEEGQRSYLQKQKSKTPKRSTKLSTPPVMPPISWLLSPEKANNKKSILYTNSSALVRAVPEHTDTSKITRATLKCPRALDSNVMKNSLHNSIHPLETEIYPLKMVCGCPCVGVTHTGHTQSSHPTECICQCKTACTCWVTPSIQLGNTTTTLIPQHHGSWSKCRHVHAG